MNVRSVRADQFLALGALAVVALYVLVEDLLELGDYGIAAQRGVELAVDVNGSLGFLKGAWQADAEIGVLRFAGAVDHATHDRELELLHPGIAFAPLGHRGA